MSKMRSYTAGFIIGTLAGSMITLLTTPKSGKQLRQDLQKAKSRFQSTANRFKQGSTELKNSAIQLGKDGKNVAKNVRIDLQSAVKGWKEEIEPNIKSLRNEIAELKERAEQSVVQIKKT